MPNRQSGAEPLNRRFKKRRRSPGENAGQFIQGTSAASWAIQRCKSTEEIGRLMVRKFGLPKKFVDVVLRKETRNAVKIMDLVRAANRELFRARRRRSKVLCTTVARFRA